MLHPVKESDKTKFQFHFPAERNECREILLAEFKYENRHWNAYYVLRKKVRLGHEVEWPQVAPSGLSPSTGLDLVESDETADGSERSSRRGGWARIAWGERVRG